MSNARRRCIQIFSILTFLLSCSGVAKKIKVATPEDRLNYIREAVVWIPRDTASLDLYSGPTDEEHWATGETIKCSFINPEDDKKKLNGYTPKFSCRSTDGTRVKVKYGIRNPEVYSEVAASRLLWALGFAADRNYSTKVACSDCPEDPWGYIKNLSSYERRRIETDPDVQSRFPWPEIYFKADRIFNPALTEKKHSGDKIEYNDIKGWTWTELNSLYSKNPEKAKVQKIHRDALTLLMSILQHADSKRENQRLMCAKGQTVTSENGVMSCTKPILVISDLGWLFGRGAFSNRLATLSRMNIKEWREERVWKDSSKCIANINPIPLTDALTPTAISEEGRQFLIKQFSKVSRAQIEDMFRGARTDMMALASRRVWVDASYADWADVLEAKMKVVAETTCPKKVSQ
jgi:hypothetical protein